MFGWLKRRNAPASEPAPTAALGQSSEQRLESVRAALRVGDDAAAGAVLESLLAEPQPSPDALHLAGVLACRRGEFPRAVELLRSATGLARTRTASWFTLAEALLETGDLEAALAALRATLEVDPRYPAAPDRIVMLLGALGRYDEAIEAYQMHRLLDWNFDATTNPVASLQAQGRLADAAAVLEARIADDPADAIAHAYLGCTLQARGRLDAAIDSYQQAVVCKPDFVFAHRKLAFALDSRGELAAALVHYRRAMDLDPSNAQAWSDYFSAELYVGDLSRESRKRDFEEYDRRFRVPLAPPSSLPMNGPRRLRVGYVSGDFCDHVINYFFEPVLERHDRSAVEVWCYDRTRQRDPVSLRLEGKSDHWRRVAGMDWEALARQVKADGIDILVDLKGHFDDNNLPLFARKPAPVQATWLGYPDTTGLRSVDAWITDRHIAADFADQVASETVVPLPRFFMCFRPLPEAPDPGPLPAAANGRITFGCFNTFAKISPAMREALADLMLAVPDAHCLITALPGGLARERLLADFESKGIARERFTLRGRSSHDDFLAAHREVDIALDSFPYNGTTTTLHALWMGVPVVTLAGATHVSRVGASILANLDLDAWVARTPGDYVEIARRSAADVGLLAELRAGLRDRLAASPIMDEAGFVRDLEAAYLALWEERGAATASSAGSRGEPPDPSSRSR